MEKLIILLVCLQLKHFFVDFILQTEEMVVSKGIYMDALGIIHSLQHALCTLVIVTFVANSFVIGVACAFIDYILHYHIDFVKVRFGSRDVTAKAFWAHLGLDQMAHQLTYLLIAYAIL